MNHVDCIGVGESVQQAAENVVISRGIRDGGPEVAWLWAKPPKGWRQGFRKQIRPPAAPHTII